MKKHVDLLDNGFIKLIKYWGEEEEIIESARMSTGGEFRGWTEDLGLLNFLYDNYHDTPFEFVGATFEVKAPIFVFREWHRHRTQSYNEASARYIALPNENFIPTKDRVWRGIEKAGANKQAGSDTDHVLTDYELDTWLALVVEAYDAAEKAYQYGLTHGVPKELARINIPVSRYSTMRVNTNLRNWIGFLRLRMAPNAQEEIRVYADEIATFLDKQFSHTINKFLIEIGKRNG